MYARTATLWRSGSESLFGASEGQDRRDFGTRVNAESNKVATPNQPRVSFIGSVTFGRRGGGAGRRGEFECRPAMSSMKIELTYH